MDRYKKTIKIRIGLLSIPFILVIALCVYYALFASDQVMENSIFCFQVGLITPLGLAATILIIRYRALLKDENKLLLQFNKENDERTKAIKAKAGIPMLPITSTLMIIAGVIAGYFNTLIFATLVVTAIVQMAICLLVKIFYMRKM